MELLQELGDVPADVQEMILNEQDNEKLKAWNKLAARAESVELFVREMN